MGTRVQRSVWLTAYSCERRELCLRIRVSQPAWTMLISHVILFNCKSATTNHTTLPFSPVMCWYPPWQQVSSGPPRIFRRTAVTFSLFCRPCVFKPKKDLLKGNCKLNTQHYRSHSWFTDFNHQKLNFYFFFYYHHPW